MTPISHLTPKVLTPISHQTDYQVTEVIFAAQYVLVNKTTAEGGQPRAPDFCQCIALLVGRAPCSKSRTADDPLSSPLSSHLNLETRTGNTLVLPARRDGTRQAIAGAKGTCAME